MTTNIEEHQRKRTLDALERRFALAEAELLQHQYKGKNKRPLENKAKVTTSITNSSVHPIPTNCASAVPPTNPLPKKGYIFLTLYTVILYEFMSILKLTLK